MVNGVRTYSLVEYRQMQKDYDGGSITNDRMKSLLDPETEKPANKYGAQKVVIDGMVFDSRAEGNRYIELKHLKYAGEIKWFNPQPSFRLPGGVRYRADFIVGDQSGKIWVEDVKGVETKDFMVKKRIFIDQYPTLELRIIKMTGRNKT